MKKTFLTFAAAAMLVPTVPAIAAGGPIAPTASDYRIDYGTTMQHDRGRHRGRYDRQGRYYEPRVLSRNERIWQDEQGRYRCRRGNGTTGLIIGAAGGALAGRAIDTRGERTTGTILGGVAGALLGREIDRGSARCR